MENRLLKYNYSKLLQILLSLRYKLIPKNTLFFDHYLA